MMLRFRLVKCWLVISYHDQPRKTFHGPQSWSWWRLFALGPVRLEVHPPSAGYRLWVYTRWGAHHIDAFIDRREQIAAK